MPATCPTTDDLAAFATGKLPSEVAEAVADHVESCPSCEATITSCEQSADTLVEQLRTPASEDTGLAELLAKAEALGTPAEPRPVLKQLRDYQLLEQLGQGGMGTVYRAVHVHLDRTVAVKVLPPERTRDPQAIARFRREMRAIGKLHHPNIVVAHDAGEADGTHFLVMELVEGLDASRLVHQVGPLPVADAAEIVRQAAAGLQHAHEHGLVHRDIKPSNLMLAVGQASSLPKKGSGVRGQGSTGAGPATVKILDLGLALLEGPQHAGDELTAASQMMGTADYVAPEQAGDSHSVDIRADIYSLGCTLFKLLTGEAPFTGKQYTTAIQKMMAHISAPPPDVRTRRPEVPPALAAVVAKMLAKEPADRYQTPAEAQAALAPFCTGADLAKLARVASGENQSPGAVEHTAPTQPTDTTSTFIRREGEAAIREGEAPAEPPGVPVGCEANHSNSGDPLSLVTAPRHSSVFSLRKHSHPRANLFTRRNLLIATASAGALLLAIAAAIVIRIQTAEGTLLLTVNGPEPDIKIDGEAAEVNVDKQGRYRIAVKPGTHTLVVTGPMGQQFETDRQFTMRPGGEVTLRARLIRKPKPAIATDPERAAAEWCLSVGGRVAIWQGREQVAIAKASDLPKQPFEIATLQLEGSIYATDDNFSRLVGLKSIYTLNLANAPLSNDGLVHIGKLKSLRTVYLDQTAVTNAGMRHLDGLENLVGLHLRGSKVTTEGLVALPRANHLKTITLGNLELTNDDLRRIAEWRNLTSLFLISSKRLTDDGTRHLTKLDQLQALSLSDLSVTDATLEAIGSMKTLQSLSLSRLQITDAGLKHLAELPALHVLELSHLNITDEGLPSISGLQGLRTLGLYETKVSDRGIAHLANLKDLRKLDLRGTLVTQAGVDSLRAALPNCKIDWSPPNPDRAAAEYVLSIGGTINVKENGQERMIRSGGNLSPGPFELSGVVLQANSNVTDEVLANFKGCRNLTYLTLCSSQVTDKGLANFQNCKSIRELVLQDTQVTDAGLANFKECKNLDYLGLITAKDVGDVGLGNFQDCNNLTRLNLTQTQVSDAGLAHFQNCKGLVHLFLAATPISDAGLAHFKDFKNLQQLILNDTQVSDASLERLAGYPKLGLLQLRATKVTEAGVKKFAVAAPQCKIEWDGGTIEPRSPIEAARPAIEAILKSSGEVAVESGGQVREIKSVDELKPDDRVHSLHLRKADDSATMATIQTFPAAAWGAEEQRAIAIECPITVVQLVALMESPGMQPVRIVSLYDGATEPSLQVLAGMPKLQFLSVYGAGGTKVGDAEVQIIAAFPQLTALQLTACTLTGKGLASLSDKPLTSLTLQDCSQIDDAALDNLKAMRTLTTLQLRGTKVTDDGVKKLAAALPQCRIVWDGGVIEPTSLPVPAPLTLEERKALEWVLANGGSLDVGLAGQLQAILAGGRLPEGPFVLHSLNLGNIKDPGGETLEKLRGVPPVRQNLNFYGTGADLTDEGLERVVTVPGLVTATDLCLFHTAVTDAGLVHVKHFQLRYLDCRECPGVTDAGLEHLAVCPKLTILHVQRTKVTKAGVDKLAAALPQCKIKWDGGVIEPTRPADPERAVAEWGLKKGGRVSISPDGQNGDFQRIEKLADLPASDFVIISIDLRGAVFAGPEELATFGLLPAGKRYDLSVYLPDTNLTDEGLAQVVRCQDITRLYLDGTHVSDTGLNQLASLTRLVHLGAPRSATDSSLKAFATIPNLKILDMPYSKVTDAGLLELKPARLTHIMVDSTDVTLRGLAAALSEHPLQSIHADIDDEKDLELLGHWPSLKSFYSNSPGVTDAGMAHFAKLEDLETLQVAYVTATSRGIVPLKKLGKLSDLRLGLGKTGDDALIELGQMPQLRFLYLNATEVTDAGLKHLVNLKELEVLGLQQTRVTEAGYKSLQAALPTCKIEWSPAEQK